VLKGNAPKGNSRFWRGVNFLCEARVIKQGSEAGGQGSGNSKIILTPESWTCGMSLFES